MTGDRQRRQIPQRYRLEATRCTDCGRIMYPPFGICRYCGRRRTELHRLALTGRLLAYTIQQCRGREADTAPRAVGIVATDCGARLVCEITDCQPSNLCAGLLVRLVFRRLGAERPNGEVLYGHKALPATCGEQGSPARNGGAS